MWQLDGNLASARFGKISLSVGLAPGDRKLLVQTSDSTLLANLWDLPAAAPLPLVDCYVRNDDLVCLLGPAESFPFYTELYWTLRHLDAVPTPLVALSLLVSVRTDLLDTHPAIEVVSDAACGGHSTFDVAGGPGFLIPLREQVTLVDFATPEDCATQAARDTVQGQLRVERTLFDHFLEKGVIRKGRLFAAIVDGEVDESAAVNLCRELLSAELPLTT